MMVESYKNDTELFNLQCWALLNSFFQQQSGNGSQMKLWIQTLILNSSF